MVTGTADPAVRGTAQGTADPAVSRLDEEFFGLVYSDEELVRDEFDDLVAAVWPGPPATPTPAGGAPRPDRPRPHRPWVGGDQEAGVVTVVPRQGARNRSPPQPTPATAHDDERRRR